MTLLAFRGLLVTVDLELIEQGSHEKNEFVRLIIDYQDADEIRIDGRPSFVFLEINQSIFYSVVLPSKCSLSASASARVWWTTPSR